MDGRLEPAIKALAQLTASDQELVISLIRQLAERDGITMALGPAMGLQTPAEGIDLWVVKMQSERYSPRTIDIYERTVRAYLKKDPIPTSLSIRSYLVARLNRVSPARVDNERKALKSFFAFLHDEGLWNGNPMERVKAVKVPKRRRPLPSEEAIQRLLTAQCYRSCDTVKFRTMLVLLLDTGLRVSEAASILKNDIELESGEIRVTGKGNKERFVPIGPTTCMLLQRYIETVSTNGSPYLFPASNSGGYWDIRSFERTMRRMCKRLGIEKVTPHQLRHYFATKCLENGAKLEVISRILGHYSVGITADVYRHVTAGEMHKEHELHSPLGHLGPRLREEELKRPMLPAGSARNEVSVEGLAL